MRKLQRSLSNKLHITYIMDDNKDHVKNHFFSRPNSCALSKQVFLSIGEIS